MDAPLVDGADVLLYPLPAVLLALPMSGLPAIWAASIFMGASIAALVYGVLRYAPSAWPVFVSWPFLICIYLNQWGILLAACVLIPALRPIGVAVKPSLALPLLAHCTLRRAALGVVGVASGLLTLSLLVLPSWPMDWLANLPRATYPRTMMAFTLPGLPLWAALWYWRRPEARLLLAMALTPHLLVPYDHVAVLLTQRRPTFGLLLAAISWVALVRPSLGTPLLYLAALALLLVDARLRDGGEKGDGADVARLPGDARQLYPG